MTKNSAEKLIQGPRRTLSAQNWKLGLIPSFLGYKVYRITLALTTSGYEYKGKIQKLNKKP